MRLLTCANSAILAKIVLENSGATFLLIYPTDLGSAELSPQAWNAAIMVPAHPSLERRSCPTLVKARDQQIRIDEWSAANPGALIATETGPTPSWSTRALLRTPKERIVPRNRSHLLLVRQDWERPAVSCCEAPRRIPD